MFFFTKYLFFQNATIISIMEKQNKKYKSLKLFAKLLFKITWGLHFKKKFSSMRHQILEF